MLKDRFTVMLRPNTLVFNSHYLLAFVIGDQDKMYQKQAQKFI